MIRVVVKSIALDNITGSPIVLLSDEKNEKDVYPIWIGVHEAEGILVGQSEFRPARPLTYDLLKNIIESLDGLVKKIEIVDLVDNAYISNIIIQQNDKEIVIDSRPSDAINIAIRFGAPIYLNEEVVKKIDLSELVSQENQQEKQLDSEDLQESYREDKSVEYINDEDVNKFKELVENIKPEDFIIDKNRDSFKG